MRIPGVKTARALSRWIKARVLGGAIILGYHRIADDPRDAYETCVTPEHFAQHLEIIRKFACPISLPQLAQHLRSGSLPARSVAVTFDDGYADNLYYAKSLLEKYQVPATVFVCTGYLGKEFWWDELVRLVAHSQKDLRGLHIQLRDSQFRWDQSLVDHRAGRPEEGAFRMKACQALYHFLLPLDYDEREKAMGAIRSWAEVPSDIPSGLRAVDHAELLTLAEGGLIDLGAHTRTHPMLPQLSPERQREEILSSKQDLEAYLGRRVAGFAYPNGRISEDAKKIVRETGFEFACASHPDVVRPGCDPYQLARFWPKDVDGDKFFRSLSRWMDMKQDA